MVSFKNKTHNDKEREMRIKKTVVNWIIVMALTGFIHSIANATTNNNTDEQSDSSISDIDIDTLKNEAIAHLVSKGAPQDEAEMAIESLFYDLNESEYKEFLLDLIYGISEQTSQDNTRGLASPRTTRKCSPTYYNASSAHLCEKCAGSDTDIELDFKISGSFSGWGISHQYSARNWRGSLIIAWHGSLIGRNVRHNNVAYLGVIVGGRWNKTLGWSLNAIRDSIKVNNIVLCPR